MEIKRINRNIVECKEVGEETRGKSEQSINRNIVECKVVFRDEMLVCPVVLIETLWNVKECIRYEIIWGNFRINRNIVECKEHKFGSD